MFPIVKSFGEKNNQPTNQEDTVTCHRELIRKKPAESWLKRKKGQNNVGEGKWVRSEISVGALES